MEQLEIRKRLLLREKLYSKYAALDKNSIRLEPIIDDLRPNYFRDIDRIIHSLAYTRYIDKTQVFSLEGNDHISKRIVHVSLVSKIARTIGRVLGLNEDLIEAASLGHDLGHVPFGHVGERILNEISLKHGEGYFNHNVQSVRILMDIEKKNISIQVLDAILCHNGEFLLQEYAPRDKTIDQFLNEIDSTYKEKDYSKKLIPMTLEGCVVRISDIIGYIGRDIQDAIELGILDESQIPKSITSILGKNNTQIINTIINDIIENSLNKNCLIISEKVFKAMKELFDFNYKYIYRLANTEEDLLFYDKAFNELFTYYLNNIDNKDHNFYKNFLAKMDDDYLNNMTNERKVIDFIAGMTDDYFMNEYNNLN